MKPRSHLPKKERHARSRLTKLVHEDPLVKGSLVTMARTCGALGCKCTRGEKHVSLYLSVRYEDKRKMIYIPTEWEERVRAWVQTHKEISELLEVLSTASVHRLMKEKEGRR